MDQKNQVQDELYERFLKTYDVIMKLRGKQITFGRDSVREEELEDIADLLSKVVDNQSDLLTVQHKDTGKNLAMISVLLGHWKIDDQVLRMLDNPEVVTQQDNVGMSVGMMAAEYRCSEIALRALDYPEAAVQQCQSGRNIGMFAAYNWLNDVVKKALDYPEAAVQQDDEGWNIGMYAAYRNLPAVIKALKNAEAAAQKDDENRTIKDILNLMNHKINVDESGS